MVITFGNSKLKKICNSERDICRKWGQECGQKIMQRLDELYDSENLFEFCLVHRRCHALKGNRQDQWSADLKHPYRLIFKITDIPIPRLADGGIDLKKVTTVQIVDVEDTHG